MLFLLLFMNIAFASPPLKILVIDSGVDTTLTSHICEDGNKSFITGESWNKDIKMQHGSNISSIIEKTAGLGDYCITHYKIFNDDNDRSIFNSIAALEEALKHDFDVINLSYGGPGQDPLEAYYIQLLLDHGTIVVTAAGNNGSNLDVHCDYYPACYDKRLIVVASLDPDKIIGTNHQLADYTNYSFKRGFVYIVTKPWELGNNTLIGTSQATAYVSGRLLKLLLKRNGNRQAQSLTQSDQEQIEKAFLIQTGMDKKLEQIVDKFTKKYIPREIQLVYGFMIPVYKTYTTGMIVIQKDF